MSRFYTAIPLGESEAIIARPRRSIPPWGIIIPAIFAALLAVVSFLLGVAVGQTRPRDTSTPSSQPGTYVLLPPQAFIPQSTKRLKVSIQRSANLLRIVIVPTKQVTFEFPTLYEDPGPDGDRLWNDLMPGTLGSMSVIFAQHPRMTWIEIFNGVSRRLGFCPRPISPTLRYASQ